MKDYKLKVLEFIMNRQRETKDKSKEFTRLTYTGLVVELEHLEIQLRSTSE